MERVPQDFVVPAGLEHERFRLRMPSVRDVDLCPSEDADVEARPGVRRDAWEAGRDPELERAVRSWVDERSPFTTSSSRGHDA